VNKTMPRLRTIVVTALAALIAPALFALDVQNAPMSNPAEPGTLNYIEGSATLNGQPVTQSAIGSMALQPGQVLATTDGRVEMLLTPGVFLRLGHDSAVKMVSPDLTNTVVDLEKGRLDVEVDQIFPQNDIHIIADRVPVQLLKVGLYQFDADRGAVMVFSGKATALRPNEKFVTIKAHHELALAHPATMKPASFDKDALEQSGLYRWSSLRSQYLAEANSQIAGEYGYGYPPGWYWDPYMLDYTFLGPWPFYSPFGWGFYPFGGGFYGGGFYGRGFYGRGGFGGFHGGGFGGFHGGGFGGGGLHGGR
jgi:hypothetical protein